MEQNLQTGEVLLTPVATQSRKQNSQVNIRFGYKDVSTRVYDVIVDAGSVKEKSAYEAHLLPGPWGVKHLMFNATHPFCKNIHFRRFLQNAFDRKTLSETSLVPAQPYAELVPPHQWGRVGALTEQNVLAAKENLEEFKKSHAFDGTLSVVASGGDGVGFEYVNAMRQQLKEYGIRLKIAYSEELFDPFQKECENYPLRLVSAGADLLDSLSYFAFFQNDGLLKKQFFEDEKYTELFEQALNASDFDTRVQRTQELGRYFIEQIRTVPLFVMPAVVHTKKGSAVKSLGDQRGGITIYLEELTS
jgi:ABC-type transport system substrate-binding protein